MPDFPQWNYVYHYHGYKELLENIDQVGYDKEAIFYLGDSFVRGAEVERGKEWVALLQQFHENYKMVNMGFGGSSQVEEYILFQHYVMTSSAKVSALILRVAERDIGSENLQHYRVYKKSGPAPFIDRLNAQMENKKRGGAIRHFLQIHSYSYRLLKYAIFDTTQYLRNPEHLHPNLIKLGDTYVQKGLPQRSCSSKARINHESIKITKQYLEKFLAYTKQNSIPLILLYLPTKQEVYEEDLAKYLDVELCGQFQGVEFLQQFVNDHNLLFLDLTEIFQQKRYNNKIFLHFDSHYNIEGHKIVAEEVSKFLKLHHLIQ